MMPYNYVIKSQSFQTALILYWVGIFVWVQKINCSQRTYKELCFTLCSELGTFTASRSISQKKAGGYADFDRALPTTT